MADSPTYRGADGNTGAGTDPAKSPGAPRWVKAFGIIGAVLVVLVVVMLLVGGDHGPGRHFGGGAPSDGAGSRTPSSNVTGGQTPHGHSGGHRPPAGAHR